MRTPSFGNLFLFILFILPWSITVAAVLDLETAVPAGWTAQSGTLSISPHHSKLGTQSLRWDWTGGDAITVSTPGIIANDITLKNLTTCSLWIWNGTAIPDGKLRIEFLNGKNVQYYFDFYLNYTGWRRALRDFNEDMVKAPSPLATFTSIRIVAPDKNTGSFFIDAVDWTGTQITRTRDAQNIDIKGLRADAGTLENYNLTSALPFIQPTQTELADLKKARQQWIDDNKMWAPSADDLTKAVIAFDNQNIIDASEGIRGKPFIDEDYSEFDFALVLARDYSWKTATANDSRDKALKLARHLWDQGNAAHSNTKPTQPTGNWGLSYTYRNLPLALILMGEGYDADMKQKMYDFFRWNYSFGEYCKQPDFSDKNSDMILLRANMELGAILMLTPNDAEAVYLLKGYLRYMDHMHSISDGDNGFIKPDGVGFHHSMHYNAYMNSYEKSAQTFWILRDTSFKLADSTYYNLRDAFLALMRMSAYYDRDNNRFGYFANALSGRKPFDTFLFPAYSLQQLGVAGGAYVTPKQAADPLIAKAYNHRFGTASRRKYDPFIPYGSDGYTLDGFYQYNYSPLGIYRRSNWVASIRALGGQFLSFESYPGENRYGRYQSYGALDILYHGGKSGQQQSGWDWKQPPGTTTIVLPDDKLVSERMTQKEMQQLKFSGALAFYDKQSGLYAANFQEGRYLNYDNVSTNHNPSFVWRKSWFAFGSEIVCLGSDIANNDTVNSTVTTLFQGALATTSTPITVDGASITAFPYSEPVPGEMQPHWLLDAYCTGYIVQPGVVGTTINITRTNQSSPHESANGTFTTGDFAKAWIDHGKAPSSGSYEYAVFPSTDAAAMTTTAAAYSNPATKPYAVIEQTSTAHVVKWLSSKQIGYAIFTTDGLSPNTQSAGLLISVTRPCLIMTQLGTSRDAWVSIVDPDLNLINDISVARTLEFTVRGSWTLDKPDEGTSIIANSSASTTIRVITQYGFAQHVHLVQNYTSWSRGFFPLQTSAPSADPDGDGVANIMEYVLGGVPTTSDSATILPTASANNNALVVQFHRAVTSKLDTVLTFQYTYELGASTVWNDLVIGAVSGGPDAKGVGYTVQNDTTTADLITITVPVGPSGRVFARLNARQVP